MVLLAALTMARSRVGRSGRVRGGTRVRSLSISARQDVLAHSMPTDSSVSEVCPASKS